MTSGTQDSQPSATPATMPMWKKALITAGLMLATGTGGYFIGAYDGNRGANINISELVPKFRTHRLVYQNGAGVDYQFELKADGSEAAFNGTLDILIKESAKLPEPDDNARRVLAVLDAADGYSDKKVMLESIAKYTPEIKKSEKKQ